MQRKPSTYLELISKRDKQMSATQESVSRALNRIVKFSWPVQSKSESQHS